MRVISEPIHVQLQHGQPTLLHWNRQPYPVRSVLDSWRWAGRWWLRDPPRDYWLLDAGITAEIYRTQQGGQTQWTLARIGD